MTTTIQNYMTKTSHMNTEVAIVTLTEKSIKSASKISDCFSKSDIFVMQKHSTKIAKCENIIFYKKLSEIVKNLFLKYSCIIFIMATGIVIRHIAPYVQDKTKDPAIIVCDEKLQFAISLLSGHIGGANDICYFLSNKINITPVITTATDVNKKDAIDTIVQNINAFEQDDRDYYKKINYKLANDKKVYLIENEYKLDTRGFTIISETDIDKSMQEDIIHITCKNITGLENIKNYKKIHPRKIVLGIGCKKNTPSDIMKSVVCEYLEKNNISKKSILTIGSIELKKEEQAIIDIANELRCNFVIFSADEIKSSKYYNTIPQNDFVSSITGVNSVSLSVAKILSDNNIICEGYKGNGITISIGQIL